VSSGPPSNGSAVRVSPEVAAALWDGRAVVALESTVFSRLGLPGAAGAEARRRAFDAVRAAGAVPALTVVLDGVARVGVDDDELPLVLGAGRKVAERDLPVAVAQRWPAGATTVSASLALAAAAGVAVFATGGIGGVHRDFAARGDESADLVALARHPVVTVCAGAKSFLDLPRTLERLETLGVPVVGLGTDAGAFPGFWSRRSGGQSVPHEVSSPEEAAAVVRAARALGHRGGLLVVTPVPQSAEVPFDELGPVIGAALAEAAAAGVAGGAVTPFVLERIATATDGRTVAANVALVEHNAALAGAIAAALSSEPPAGRR
jgi:pseudouridylate synthase